MVAKPKVTRQLTNIEIDLLFSGFTTGLGLHLKELAQQLPGRYDLHEPNRLLSSLSEYEHLHRIFRLCHVHVSRNIKTANVSEGVKNKMRSLVCIQHDDFEGTLRQIENEGGKVGSGMSLISTNMHFTFS